jgi:molecular chaperone GrpE
MLHKKKEEKESLNGKNDKPSLNSSAEDKISDEKQINKIDDDSNQNSTETINELSEETAAAEKIKQLESEINMLRDMLLRKAAEFENYKRRTENDQLNLIKYAAESFIIKLLPIVDDFERSLPHINNTQNNEAVIKGIQLVYEKLMKLLEEQGVKKMETVGKHFNVDYHDALMQRADENVPPHTVLEEIEKGYIYKDRVIRHAKVIISTESTELPADENESQVSESNNTEDK